MRFPCTIYGPGPYKHARTVLARPDVDYTKAEATAIEAAALPGQPGAVGEDLEVEAPQRPPKRRRQPRKAPDADTPADEDAAPATEELNHLGGGWYELPNGERVRGHDQAIAALAALDGAAPPSGPVDLAKKAAEV